MRLVLLATLAFAMSTLPAAGQLPDAELRQMIQQAESDPGPVSHLQAANAARLLRDHETAREHLDAAWDASYPLITGLVNSRIMLELASGGGTTGAQRAFRDAREIFNFPPRMIAGNFATNYPELLASGEFDELVQRLSPEAEDVGYRCGCYNTVAWVHRLAGREEEARAIWSKLADQSLGTVDAVANPNQEANARGQLARDLARAGRVEEAREQLRRSMSIEVSEGAMPTVRRRWAQAFAELGDVASTVEHLEPLLEANTLVTVESLEARVAWARVRDTPEFQALLARHR